MLGLTEKFDEAQKTLADAVADLEKTPTASSAFCKVHIPNDHKIKLFIWVFLSQTLLNDLVRCIDNVKSEEEYKQGRHYIVSK